MTLEVLEQFKGEPVDHVTLDASSSCSFSKFAFGATYLVEATPNGAGALHAYLCSHTQRVDQESRDLDVVRRRAAWWKSRLGRVSWYRFRHFLGRLAG